MTRYGGIDLGGTKIQTVVTDEAHEVLGSARHPTPTTGGPADVTLAMIAALREAAEHAGVGRGELTAVGVGSPGRGRRRGRHRDQRAQPARLGGQLPARREARGRPGGAGRALQRRQRRDQGGVRARRGKPFQSILGVFWGTGVGGGVVLDGELWEGRGAAGEIGHMVVKSDGRTCPCGRIGCMEAYAGRGAMEVRAREKAAEGEKTVLFEIMEERGKPRLSSGIWERALERDDKLAHQLVDRAVEAIGVARRLGAEPARRRGRRDRRRARACGSASPTSSASARRSCRTCSPTTGRPRCCSQSLGDLGGAIGATLLAAQQAPLPRSERLLVDHEVGRGPEPQHLPPGTSGRRPPRRRA